ncbi:Imm30 family immunity protein [Vibrio quintilis]|uniref:Immunity protein 30 domain-containing protein n=1 Tax=Vibrio quintilis TaxID=1117707 RepID=A0A1M7YSX5_9VIBR|nr:Imm30 family immunity protein [Vibrio quintilis]SHO55718.1 hypothetical protein VQ7734_01464 [Vibrio quintilis]
MNYEEKSQKLRNYLYAEDTDDFEMLLQQIYQDKTSDAVTCLIRSLEEKSDFLDEMYLILHTAESYPMKTYLHGLLMTLFEPVANRYWLEVLFLRVINNSQYFSELNNMLVSVQTEQLINLKNILEDMSIKNEDLQTKSIVLSNSIDELINNKG